MARRSKRIANATAAIEPTGKKTKLSHDDGISELFSSTAKKGDVVAENDSTREVAQPTLPNNTAIPGTDGQLRSLATLPAEIQQQIYWFAIEDEFNPYFESFWYSEHRAAYQLIRVSRAVQDHVMKVVEIWGCHKRKKYMEILLHKHHHELAKMPSLGDCQNLYSRRVDGRIVPCCGIGSLQVTKLAGL